MTDEFMLCKSIESLEEINLKDFIGELKEDGERIQAVKIGDDLSLWNRRGREKLAIYPEIKELKKLDFDFIVDGEVITIDGIFNSLQHRSNLQDKRKIERRLKEYPVKFMIFDILFFNGKKLIKLPLIERKKYLENFRGLESVEVLDYFENKDIRELWNWVKENNKEGIILKLKSSPYIIGNRGLWKKLKYWKEQTITFTYYELNPSGIKLTSEDGLYEVQVQGNERAEKIKERLDNKEKVDVCVQFLEETKNKKLRFPSCREVILNHYDSQ